MKLGECVSAGRWRPGDLRSGDREVDLDLDLALYKALPLWLLVVEYTDFSGESLRP